MANLTQIDEEKVETSSTVTVAPTVKTGARWFILVLCCLGILVNFLDRTNLSVAAPVLSKELGLTPIVMGIIFSCWNFAYTAAQIPAGWALDRFGTRVIYSVSLFVWSLLTAFCGLMTSVVTFGACRAGIGLFEAASFPANARVAASWFPSKERGTALGTCIGFQYIGQAFCTPLLAWLVVAFGWPSVFYVTGAIGLVVAAVWWVRYREPKEFPGINQAELDYIRQGEAKNAQDTRKVSRSAIKGLFTHRVLWCMYIGQFAISSSVWFFLNWLPTYLATEKGLGMMKMGFYAAVPFIGALLGAMLGARFSDRLLRHGFSLGAARRIPVIFGLILATGVVLANFTDDINLVTVIMFFCLFGQATSNAVAWTLMADVAPAGLTGFYAGSFNLFANLGGTLCPLVVGFIVGQTHSFSLALVFVSSVTVMGAIAYFCMGTVKRIEIPQ